MERIKKIIKNLFFAVMLLAITISDGSFANIKKVKAAENADSSISCSYKQATCTARGTGGTD